MKHPTLEVARRDSIDEVRAKLNIVDSPSPLPESAPPATYFRMSELGFWVFFNDEGRVYSIRFESPYPHAVEGIRIGNTREQVLHARGKPDRHFPVPDRKERWIYDTPKFYRVDFDPKTQTVQSIFR